jgi:hypothetical protein
LLGRIARRDTRGAGPKPSAFLLRTAHDMPRARRRADSHHCSRYNTNNQPDGGDVRAVFDSIAAHLGREVASRSPRPDRRLASPTPFDARELIASLPHRPGVIERSMPPATRCMWARRAT